MNGKIERKSMNKPIMHPNVQPLKDIAAKIVLGKPYNRSILENLLSAILQEKVEVERVDVETSWLGSRIEEKVPRSDIKIETKKAIILLEIQNYEDCTYELRITGYIAKCITEQLEKGIPYQELKKVIVISITDNCDIAPNVPTFYAKTVRVLEEYRDIPVFNLVEHYILDIQKYRKLKEIDLDNRIHQWAEFFKYEEEEKIKMVTKKNIDIEKALEEYDRLMADEEVRKQLQAIHYARLENKIMMESIKYEGRQKGIQQGRQEGIQEERMKHIKNMVKEGLSDELIMKITKLTKKELDKEKAVLGCS